MTQHDLSQAKRMHRKSKEDAAKTVGYTLSRGACERAVQMLEDAGVVNKVTSQGNSVVLSVALKDREALHTACNQDN